MLWMTLEPLGTFLHIYSLNPYQCVWKMALGPPGEFPSHFLIRSLSKCLENCPGAPGQFASHFFISLGNSAWNVCHCYLEGFIGHSGSMCSIDFIWTYNIQTFDATLGVHSVSIALGKHLKLKGQHAQHHEPSEATVDCGFSIDCESNTQGLYGQGVRGPSILNFIIL